MFSIYTSKHCMPFKEDVTQKDWKKKVDKLSSLYFDFKYSINKYFEIIWVFKF